MTADQRLGRRRADDGRRPIDGKAIPPLRIFLVENHADIARAMAMYLQASGYDVQHAGDVRSARALAHDNDFDIVVIDLGLPVAMDGSPAGACSYGDFQGDRDELIQHG
ncbi:MAG: response regulator [Chthoniobacterales bacterium]|nr:response regulator [Chthoniobacterales bacterium]